MDGSKAQFCSSMLHLNWRTRGTWSIDLMFSKVTSWPMVCKCGWLQASKYTLSSPGRYTPVLKRKTTVCGVCSDALAVTRVLGIVSIKVCGKVFTCIYYIKGIYVYVVWPWSKSLSQPMGVSPERESQIRTLLERRAVTHRDSRSTARSDARLRTAFCGRFVSNTKDQVMLSLAKWS